MSLCLCCVCVSYVHAQSSQNWGVRGGVNLSMMEMTRAIFVDSEDSKSKVGWCVGFVGNVNSKRLFSIQPGLYFTTLGVKFEGELQGEKVTENDKLYYFQLPVLGCFTIPLSGLKNRWQWFVGPYVGYSMGGKGKFKDKGKEVKVSLFSAGEGNANGTLKKFDWGLTLGTGFTFDRIFVGLYYDLGMIDIANKDVLSGVTAKNRNLSLTMGVNF